MDQLLEYKCPCCGGGVEFNAGTQQLTCPYCDTTFDVEAMQELDSAMENAQPDSLSWDTPQEEWTGAEAAGMKVYICQSCGGEVVTDETTTATHCPYCDNPIAMTGSLSGALKPDYIIPFQLDKEAAKDALRKHLKGKRLLPKLFASENHLDEVRGVYVPFWLFDADAEADLHFRGEMLRHWEDSRYEYTEHSYYDLRRGGTVSFDHVPVDGSSKMPDELMESLEPFDFSKAVDFRTAYLAGYMADRYDVDADASIERANERVKRSTENAFSATATGYSSIQATDTSVRLSNGKAKYALYPVWLLNTTWKGEKYTFAMNGQTGKFVGDLPTDRGAYWKWRLIYTGIFAAAIIALAVLISLL